MPKPGVVIFRDEFYPPVDDAGSISETPRLECDHVDPQPEKDKVYARCDGEGWHFHWSDVKAVVRPLESDGTPSQRRTGKLGGSA